MPVQKRSIEKNYDQARNLLMRWCALQDRSRYDATKKLMQWGLSEQERDTLLTELTELNFLDDERFAQSYVTGHIKLKKWGRYKLLNGLKKHGISEQIYQPVLDCLDQQMYIANLKDILQTKLRLKPTASKEQLWRFALQRGFEHHLIMRELELL